MLNGAPIVTDPEHDAMNHPSPTSFPIQESLSELDRQFERMRTLVQRAQERDEAVSGWTVGDHLEHICTVAAGFGVVLITGRGPVFEAAMPEARHMVLSDGHIPRGKIKAPPAASPKGLASIDAYTRMLDKTLTRLKSAAQQPDERTADHPLLGTMTRDEVLRFVVVHTAHHLGIIDDYGKAAG